MFELIYQQLSTVSPIKAFYPSLGQAFLAAKTLRQSNIFRMQVLSPAGKPVLSWERKG
jgi:hypothetical protein